MNIVEELVGKEVIDDSGNLMGVVKDVTWDFNDNTVQSLVVEEKGAGLSSMFRSSPKKLILYENIHSIGDKILINTHLTVTEEDKDEFGLNRFKLDF
ncbi:MAG: PRC-barrel domain-containing protein [Methanothermobacter sp.]